MTLAISNLINHEHCIDSIVVLHLLKAAFKVVVFDIIRLFEAELFGRLVKTIREFHKNDLLHAI